MKNYINDKWNIALKNLIQSNLGSIKMEKYYGESF